MDIALLTPEQRRIRRRYAENPDYFKERARRRKTPKKKYPEADKARSARRYAADPDYFKIKSARWQAANPAPSRVAAGRRRALIKQRTCACCTPASFRTLYQEAAEKGWEVDHAIPLCIGGLHCVKNLQLLTPEEHKRKTRADIAELHAF